jgi:FdrA protein
MPVHVAIRRSAYYDSVTLLEAQKRIVAEPGVEDAGLVMGTAANLALLKDAGLWDEQARTAGPNDLVAAVRAADGAQAEDVLRRLDLFLSRPRSSTDGHDYRPKTLASAKRLAPASQLAVISVPGRFAREVAEDAIRQGLHVLLFSDNVPVADEVYLKDLAARTDRLVMGPDAGTALIGGVGLGFANRVARGRVGVVGASGTGIQLVTTLVERFGGGISHALGTGGRDLSREVGGRTMMRALEALIADPATEVIVLLSKPPDPAVADRLLSRASTAGKPVIVHFLGGARERRGDSLQYAEGLAEAALQAALTAPRADPPPAFAPGQRDIRGLYAGGTLAYEAFAILSAELGPVYSNLADDPTHRPPDPLVSHGHTVIDLGDDVFTVGRLHPMIDQSYRLRRLLQEADDPACAVVLLDVVLGVGAAPDPASELAPVVREARARAAAHGRALEVVVALLGSPGDPQDLDDQARRLREAGARVYGINAQAARAAVNLVRPRDERVGEAKPLSDLLDQPLSVINIGLDLFADGLKAQGVPVVAVDWKPRAGGDSRLASLLDKLQ